MRAIRKIHAVERKEDPPPKFGSRAVHGSGETPNFACLADYIESLPGATLTVKQVAAIYCKSEKLIYAMAKRGALPSFRFGGVVIDKFKLVAWQRLRDAA